MNFKLSKRTRSYIFLVLTVLAIFAINALLPTISGKSHYTADEITVTYKEYTQLKEADPYYTLTWSSEEKVNNYIKEYKKMYPEEALSVVNIPDDFEVEVYTKFFFQHSFWYISTITRTVSAILLFYAVFNVLCAKLKEEHVRYLELNKEMDTLSNNQLDPSSFEPWMSDVFNHDRKLNQHIDNVKYSLSLLEKHTPHSIRRLAIKDPSNPKCKTYIERKESLQAQLEEDYLKDVVVHTNVRHFQYIHPTFVLCGVNHIGRSTDSYSLIESDAKHLGRGALQKILTTLGVTVMFATLLTITVVAAADRPWYWIVIDILTTITPLLIQIPMAFEYSDSYMEDHLIPNLIARRSIALLYLAYIKKGEPNEETDITRD